MAKSAPVAVDGLEAGLATLRAGIAGCLEGLQTCRVEGMGPVEALRSVGMDVPPLIAVPLNQSLLGLLDDALAAAAAPDAE